MINLIISVTNVNRGGLACQAMLTRIKKLVTNAFLIQSTTANM